MMNQFASQVLLSPFPPIKPAFTNITWRYTMQLSFITVDIYLCSHSKSIESYLMCVYSEAKMFTQKI